MNQETLDALIGIVPQLLWLVVVVAVLVALRKPILHDLLPRLAGLRLGVVELTLEPAAVEHAVAQAAAATGATVPAPGFGEAVVRRAGRIADELRRTAVLWHDPRPANNLRERQLLHDLGVFVEVVTTPDAVRDALAAPALRPFDVVISNMGRDRVGEQVRDVVAERPTPPRLVYYVGRHDPNAGVPPGAFGITNRPDELLHLVMDVVERRQSA